MTARTPREAAEAFDHFARAQCPGSPLYQRLAAAVAIDADLLDIAVGCPRDQPRVELFRYQDGRRDVSYLGTCDPHGAWLRWEA